MKKRTVSIIYELCDMDKTISVSLETVVRLFFFCTNNYETNPGHSFYAEKTAFGATGRRTKQKAVILSADNQ